jgi:hypothetical protein
MYLTHRLFDSNVRPLTRLEVLGGAANDGCRWAFTPSESLDAVQDGKAAGRVEIARSRVAYGPKGYVLRVD